MNISFNNKYIYMLYIPRTWDWRLPFSIGKGSIAALEGAAREQEGARGSKREQEEQEGARGREHYGAVCRGVAGGSLKWVSLCARCKSEISACI